MKNLTRYLLLLPIFLPILASGQQNPAALHQEIEVLKQRIAALEARVSNQDATIRQLQLSQTSRGTAPSTYEAPQNVTSAGNVQTGGLSIMDRLRSGISYTSLPPSGPWANPANWGSLAKGMSPDDVVKLLGKPLFSKDSTRPRADEYWQYAGKLPNGEQLQGRVRYYRGSVVDWDVPKF